MFRLHAHGLVAKIPPSRRWRVPLAGRRTMTTAIKLREVAYHSCLSQPLCRRSLNRGNIFAKNKEPTDEESTDEESIPARTVRYPRP